MRCDIILTGVGGQGVLSLSALIADAALSEGLSIKQSELHGMSQRGGSVQADLRLADRSIASPTIPDGDATLILSMEPMEALRSLSRLSAEGTVVSSAAAVRNMDDYPEVETVLDAIRRLPRSVVVDAEALAKECRAPRGGNMVLIGAAARFLPIGIASLEAAIRKRFALKGGAIIEANLRALAAGVETADAAAAAGA